MRKPLTILEAPLDCSGTGRGEERAPAALLDAGLGELLGAGTAGVADALIRDSARDPTTGVVGAVEIRRAAASIAAGAEQILEAGELPVVVGGDCTLLLGVFDAVEAGCGLWFVDGHADFYDGASSPTGEAADMDLAILTGHGPAGWYGDADAPLDPRSVFVLGHRPDELGADTAHENARVDSAIRARTTAQVRDRGAAATGAEARAALGDRPAWLHIDLDVVDETALPAVTYPQPLGLGWDELISLARPLAAAPNLLGVSIADFNPDRDAEGIHAERTVEAIASILSARNA